MGKLIALGLGALIVIGSAVYWVAANGDKKTTFRNASYDPTRELYKEIDERFAAQYEKETGVKLDIKLSNGGSGSQARAIIDGTVQADVATLALPSDTDAIRQKGLLAEGWQQRLPNDSLPYLSTIVFVVRKGNDKGIKDWADLVEKPGIEIITPNPKTSGNGKLSFLAAWGSVVTSGGSEEEARSYVRRLYARVPVLDGAARNATLTFAKRKIGDVHLTWENEAHLELKEYPGELEIVYPSRSIRAEPAVAWVDKVVDKRGTKSIAEAYLRFLYTDEAQEIIAKNHYRPTSPEVFKKHAAAFPAMELFSVTKLAKDWNDANEVFFKDGGIYDQVSRKGER